MMFSLENRLSKNQELTFSYYIKLTKKLNTMLSLFLMLMDTIVVQLLCKNPWNFFQLKSVFNKNVSFSFVLFKTLKSLLGTQ